MKLLTASFALLLAVAAPALAQSPDEATVNRALDALDKAMIAVDTQQLEKLTWPELSYGHSRGRLGIATGTPVKSEFEFVMIWQKRAGEWRLLVRQAYRV